MLLVYSQCRVVVFVLVYLSDTEPGNQMLFPFLLFFSLDFILNHMDLEHFFLMNIKLRSHFYIVIQASLFIAHYLLKKKKRKSTHR